MIPGGITAVNPLLTTVIDSYGSLDLKLFNLTLAIFLYSFIIIKFLHQFLFFRFFKIFIRQLDGNFNQNPV